MSAVTEAYQCGSCEEWHDDEYDARECCAPLVIDGFKCNSCGEYHNLKINAENCCEFLCSECGEWSYEKGVCATCGNDMTVDKPTPAQLEAAGQQRLDL